MNKSQPRKKIADGLSNTHVTLLYSNIVSIEITTKAKRF